MTRNSTHRGQLLHASVVMVLSLAQLTIWAGARADSIARGFLYALLFAAVILAPLGLFIVLWIPRSRRQLGGREQARLFGQAIRSGQLPPAADAERWRPILTRRLGSPRQRRFLLISQAGFAVVIVIQVLASGWDSAAKITGCLAAIASAVTVATLNARLGAHQAEVTQQLLDQIPAPPHPRREM